MATPERYRPPWVVVMDSTLRGNHHAYNPLCVFTSRPEVPWFGETTLPPDIKRVVMVLACLSPVEDFGEIPLVTGAWCWILPASASGETHFCRRSEGARRGLEFRHPELRGCRLLRTLGDALQARDKLEVVLHAPNQSGKATGTAWNMAVERCLRPRTPIAQAFVHFPAMARLLWSDCRPARGRSHGLEAGSKHVDVTHA
jgi:hypothetical protein